MGYMISSACVGGIVTYLYDDMKNPKVNTVIKVGELLPGKT